MPIRCAYSVLVKRHAPAMFTSLNAFMSNGSLGMKVSISCRKALFGKLTRVADHSILFSDCAYSIRRVRLLSIVPRCRMSGRNFGISPVQGSRFLEVFNELLTSLGTQTVLIHCVDMHRNSYSMNFSNTCDGEVSVANPKEIGWL